MSEQTPITGSFIWTLDDVKISQEVVAGRPVTIKGKLLTYAFLLIMVVALFAFLSITNKVSFLSLFTDPYIILVSLTGIIIFYIFIRYSQSANLKKAFLQSPACNKPVEITITQDEIIAKVEGVSENKWNWNTIKEVQRNSLGFCFFQADKAGLWIPLRTFASKANADSVTELVHRLVQAKPSLKYKEVA